ncbi:MAG: NAD(P)H-dependent oxidoreductase [Rhodococcus sp.]|uniref:FMN-dependent NADH-azoreductase n=1 Tax=Rhodococcoides fascians TaxID=1828 RepID=UPI0009B8342E|nr:MULTISPECIES: NAD(P)H-dependent oxidoreductase [Rhodococcus]MBJ7324730.1 NAD(P)H-dependent oxidoreductase [Rhodococcus sp. (in: high G+C Gram-positive bacteria)]MBJ7349088.1 NAD(P)H-dependent oxidoreductase [Rhodococcus sp. (in: high G+C Gram-positive bacteria)]MBY4215055.1 NAD(P)H-dependent oxidoreductase [Rhodococcus fascians]MBY4240571.1 NAD(P)H-dependent oxidoreductase [Rhodococcus fascians]MBY4256196.1 NAD(P)H-dependent oxidoreductase [Rhodococcus fascians]
MPQLLHLDSSADLSRSISRRVTAHFSDAWHSIGTDHSVIRRDLHANALPHLPTSALHWAPHLRTADEAVDAAAEALQVELIEELISADVVLIGAPMYNWSIPSTLKAWIDYVHVPGITVPFDGDTAPLVGKPAVVVTSRGNEYTPGSEAASIDHTTGQLRQVLGAALGMDVHFVPIDLTLAERVAGLAPKIPQARASLDAAFSAVDELARRLGTISPV